MIYESYVYKEELGRIYSRMHKRSTQKRWTGRSLFLLEKDLFMAFFLIRKLIEGKTKLSKEVSAQRVELTKYPASGEKPTLLNNHKLEKLYDLESPHKITKDLQFVCSQFVHSYAFSPVIDHKKGLHSILFNSLNARETALYQISIEAIIAVLLSVSNCYIASMLMVFDAKTGDYIVKEAS